MIESGLLKSDKGSTAGNNKKTANNIDATSSEKSEVVVILSYKVKSSRGELLSQVSKRIVLDYCHF